MKYFISGHRDLSYEDFRKYYVPVILDIIRSDRNPIFVVGDCEGVDKYAMDFIYNSLNQMHGYMESPYYLAIFHMFDSPRNTPNGLPEEELEKKGVLFARGFKSDEERDASMTNVSNYDIAFVKDNRWDSGTAQNIKRRHNIK